MWKLLPLLGVLVNLILTVSSEKCAADETYVICPEKLCQPQVCEEVGFPLCSSHQENYIHGSEDKSDPKAGTEEPCSGLPACVCKENYVRNHDGICMPAENCPSCGNDKNSTFGCGINCGRRCSNYDKGPVSCAEKCNTNSCECKEGYVFDDYRGYCVKPEDCSYKDPPEPKGTEGTPEKGEDTDTNPCNDCEKNCYAQGTTRPNGGEKTCTTEGGDEGEGTKDPNADNSSTSTTAASSENSTISQATNRSKRAITKSSGNSSPSTEELEEGTTQNNEGEGVEENMTTEKSEDPGMGSKTRKPKKKRRKTTTASSGEPSSSANVSKITTEGLESEATTVGTAMETTIEESGMGSKTRKPKKKRRKTTTASSREPDSSTDGLTITTAGSVSEPTISESRTETSTEGSESKATTGDSGMESKTRKPKKKRRKTTTASSGEPNSSTDVSKITTEGLESEATTVGTAMETTIGDSGMGSKTHKPKKKRRKTTTTSSGEPNTSTDASKITTEGLESEATTVGTGMETTIGDSGMGSKTHKPKKKRRKTTTTSSGEPNTSNDVSKITTEGLESEATTVGTGMETTIEDSGMGSKTRKPKKKRRKTTTASSRDSSTDGLAMTTARSVSEATISESRTETSTEGSGSKATTGDSGMGSKTRKPKKKRRKTTTVGGADMETITGNSGKELTTHKHKIKTKIYRITTTASIKSPKSSTDGSEMTSEESGLESTTKESEEEITIEDSKGPEMTDNPDTRSTTESTEYSECKETTEHPDTGSTTESTDELNTTTEEEPESTCTTEASNTTKRTKRPRTTTKSIGETTTRRIKITKTRRNTTASGEGTTGETETTTLTEGSSSTTTTYDLGNTTTNSTMTTTEQKSTTKRGPKDCKGKHERYFPCPPSCPQQTCGDYLNGIKCSKNNGLPKCKPECRCLTGYYKDVEGNCLSTRECKRWAKSMASSTTSGKLNNPDTTAASTLTMMSTTPEPNCAEVAKELFIKGDLAYTVKLLSDMTEFDPDNNVLVGGASILYLFAQLVLGAKHKVKTEILKVFNLPDTQHVSCFFPEISALLTAEYPDIEYSLFCKIYADVDYALTNDFIRRTTQLFVMGPENLDFSSSEAAQKINSDVAQYTNDHFLNYVKPRTLLSLDGLVLVDAEGFQGKWEKPFNPANTIMKDFFSPDRVEKIPTMHQRGLFLFTYSATLNSKILKLRYRGGRFSLVIFLPNSVYGIKDLLRKMENPSNVASALDSLKYEKVNVDLPKFNVSVANRLKMSSEMAGIKEIFNNATTGLEDIGAKKPPYVGEILQKLNYAINEYGMGDEDVDFPASENPRLPKFAITHTFKADHSFVFIVNFDKLVLNAGLFVN